jgi:hypothetical protein
MPKRSRQLCRWFVKPVSFPHTDRYEACSNSARARTSGDRVAPAGGAFEVRELLGLPGRVGRVRRTSRRMPLGQPGRVLRPVSSAMCAVVTVVPSWVRVSPHAAWGSRAMEVSSASVFQPTR